MFHPKNVSIRICLQTEQGPGPNARTGLCFFPKCLSHFLCRVCSHNKDSHTYGNVIRSKSDSPDSLNF